jgi:hypothetical protein
VILIELMVTKKKVVAKPSMVVVVEVVETVTGGVVIIVLKVIVVLLVIIFGLVVCVEEVVGMKVLSKAIVLELVDKIMLKIAALVVTAPRAGVEVLSTVPRLLIMGARVKATTTVWLLG